MQQKTTPHQQRSIPSETTSQRRRFFSTRWLMAKNTQKVRRSDWHWTNERHVHFLNSMEASFVQSMFESNGHFRPPLDRYLPDTSESTEDLWKERRRRHSTSDIVASSGRADKKTRILSCQKSSQDQVVPQFQNKRDDRDEDEKDHL